MTREDVASNPVIVRMLTIYEIVQNIGFPILMGGFVFLFSQAQDHENRVTVLEQAVVHADTKTMKDSLDVVKVQMAVTQTQISSLANVVDRIERKLDP